MRYDLGYDDISKRQQVVEDFRRARRLAWLALLPLAAAVVVGVEAYGHPDFRVAGLSGEELLYTTMAVGAIALAAHFLLWRCPACGTPLWLRRGFDPGYCHSCGALFQEAKDAPAADAETHRRSQAEAAIAKEIGNYRGRWALRFLRGLICAVIGVCAMLYARPMPGPPGPDATLLRRFGEHDATLMIIGLSGLLTLFGIGVMIWSVRAMTDGARRRAERARGFLRVPPESGATP